MRSDRFFVTLIWSSMEILLWAFGILFTVHWSTFNGIKTASLLAWQPLPLRFCWALPDHSNYSRLCCCTGSTPRKYWKFPFSSSRIAHRQQFLARPYTRSSGSNAKHHSLQKQFISMRLCRTLLSFILICRNIVPFCRIFRHIVGRTPGKCSKSGCCLQSVIERVLLSNGSAHFGSASERQSQHFILKTVKEFDDGMES